MTAENDADREAFEAWAKAVMKFSLMERAGETYMGAAAECSWLAWQAAPAHTRQPGEPVAYLISEPNGDRDLSFDDLMPADREAGYRSQPLYSPAPPAPVATSRADCKWPTGRFDIRDTEGEHDPCYLIFPDGGMVALNHWNGKTASGEYVDVARAKFIRDACNAALTQPNDDDAAYEMGRRDGYEDAVQEIDVKTGGDGEYRCSIGNPDRHTPTPAAMIRRIVDRFNAAPSPASPEKGTERMREALELIAGLPDDKPGERGGLRRARHIAKCALATLPAEPEGED